MSPSFRDDFPDTMKRVLAARVNFCCSRPGCRAPTTGPQEDASKAVNVGVAAHITAAAPGGPRYDQALTHEQRTAITNGLWLCQNCAKLVDNDPVQFTTDILRGWKSKAEQEARDLVGKTAARYVEGHEISTAANARSRESTITRNLALKKRLRKDLLKDAKAVDWEKADRWPYEKFEHSEVIVHSIDDTIYPDGDVEETGISGWFKLEIWDFYHNGLEFIIGSNYGVMDSEGHWSLIKYKQSFNETQYRLIEMLCLARIPFRNIVEVDLIGDEYYPQPHIYCRFADGGEPYEGFRYVLISDDYPWPMEPDRQFDINTAGKK